MMLLMEIKNNGDNNDAHGGRNDEGGGGNYDGGDNADGVAKDGGRADSDDKDNTDFEDDVDVKDKFLQSNFISIFTICDANLLFPSSIICK